MKRFVIIFFLLPIILSAYANTSSVSYQSIVKATNLDLFLYENIGPLNRLKFKVRLTPKDASIKKDELELKMTSNQSLHIYPADYNGNVDLEISQALFKENPRGFINKTGKSSVMIGLDISIIHDAPAKIEKEEIKEALLQYAHALSKVGFLTRIMAPKFSQFRIRLNNKANCVVINENNKPSSSKESKDHSFSLDGLDRIKSITCSENIYSVYLEI